MPSWQFRPSRRAAGDKIKGAAPREKTRRACAVPNPNTAQRKKPRRAEKTTSKEPEKTEALTMRKEKNAPARLIKTRRVVTFF